MEYAMMASAASQTDVLQFGHGGEAVEYDLKAGVSSVAFNPLQFGHGGEAVEYVRSGREPDESRLASIRPRR